MTSDAAWKAKIAAGRIACVTPFCRRTGRPDPQCRAIICGKCFQRLPKSLRRRMLFVRRQIRAGLPPEKQHQALEIDWKLWSKAEQWLQDNPAL